MIFTSSKIMNYKLQINPAVKSKQKQLVQLNSSATQQKNILLRDISSSSTVQLAFVSSEGIKIS